MAVFEEYSLGDWAGLPQTKFADMPTKLDGRWAQDRVYRGKVVNLTQIWREAMGVTKNYLKIVIYNPDKMMMDSSC